MDPLVRDWSRFFDRCLQARLSPDLFDATATQLYRKSPLPAKNLASLLLKPRRPAAISLDPRIIVYTERLLASRKIDAGDVLHAAFQYSRDRPSKPVEDAVPSKEDPSRWQNPSELEEIIFHRLHKAFQSDTGERPLSALETGRTVTQVSIWMSAMVTSHTNDSMIQAMAGVQQQPQQHVINVRDALGMLVMSLIENTRVLEWLSRDVAKATRKRFSQALAIFIPFLSQTSLQISNRLEMSQRQHDFHEKPAQAVNGETTGGHGIEVAALQLEAVVDLPIVNTRAGLFVFLNALLIARPLTDDATIINYLHARYKVDAQSMTTDLITASFDILANAMYRNEPSQTMFCLKSFLVNKVPLLLTHISTAIYPVNTELCITTALSHVDSNAFPAFSQGFDDMMNNNSSLADVRQDFLNACALHGLIPANTIERLLGETPMQGPPETKFNRKDLFVQCKDNFDKVNLYVDELENLDGNAGAIVGAVTDYISHLCETQMTMYLKTLCNLLSKKPQALDVMLQFTSPASILRPLCDFLDEWRYDGDQGEYQPVYDEFGAILVLILAFVHRYDLTYQDLGIGHGSFVAQLLERGHISTTPDDLTEEQGRHLGSWLRELYDSDKEGLSNEVFASCRPQDFYFIVPTLFSQTVMACSAGVLSIDSVKGGLEYFHNNFLLPALVGGLTWMASHALQQAHQDIDILLQVFDKLIQSGPTSGDGQAMHSTIISISSRHLDKCFRTLKRRHPSRTDIEPLLQAIKSNIHYERSMYAPTAELEQWTSTPHTTLKSSLRHAVQSLSQWGATPTLQLTPPSYTHRMVFACAKILGTSETLRVIAREVKTQTESGNGAGALDVAVSIICAPTSENSPMPPDPLTSSAPPLRTQINLREMLKVEFDNAASLVSSDPSTAEAIVRLHRRVEAQLLVVAQATQINLPNVTIVDVSTQNNLDKALNDVAVVAASMAAAGAAADLQSQDPGVLQSLDQHLDLAAAGGALDLSGMGMGTQGGADLSADMGNLPDLDLGDMGGMGMDLGEEDDGWGLDFDNM